MKRKAERQSELDKVDAVMDRVRTAAGNPQDARHSEAKQLSYKLATDFSVPAKTLLECSTFWNK